MKYEYMTVVFLGEHDFFISNAADLEDALDKKASMGWRLHTINYLELTNTNMKALIIFERENT
jgi:hypothetical protein